MIGSIVKCVLPSLQVRINRQSSTAQVHVALPRGFTVNERIMLRAGEVDSTIEVVLPLIHVNMSPPITIDMDVNLPKLRVSVVQAGYVLAELPALRVTMDVDAGEMAEVRPVLPSLQATIRTGGRAFASLRPIEATVLIDVSVMAKLITSIALHPLEATLHGGAIVGITLPSLSAYLGASQVHTASIEANLPAIKSTLRCYIHDGGGGGLPPGTGFLNVTLPLPAVTIKQGGVSRILATLRPLQVKITQEHRDYNVQVLVRLPELLAELQCEVDALTGIYAVLPSINSTLREDTVYNDDVAEFERVC